MTRSRPVLLLSLIVPLLVIGSISNKAAADDSLGNSSSNRLVNLDTAATVSKHAVDGGFDIRLLDHGEDIAFTSFNLRYGITPQLEAGFRAVTGTTRTFTAGNGASIVHGGRDAEVYGKYNVGSCNGFRIAVQGGVSFPATPAQTQATGTLSVAGEVKLHDRVMGYLNPRALFLKSNTIAGIGVGTSIRISDRVHVVGDWTGIAAGDNTRSTADGSRKRGDIWGVAMRFSSGEENGRIDLDLGYGNATGSTTGFSLTPGLGNASGFYLALRARR